jgi:hypothetical protein
MEKTNTYHRQLRKHLTLFIFMLVLISLIFIKRVSGRQKIQTSDSNQTTQTISL